MILHSRNHIFFTDVETTGFDPIRNDIVSASVIVQNQHTREVAGEFYECTRPDFNKFYSEESERIHGFPRSQLESFQSRKSFNIRLLKFLAPFREPDKYHNLVFHAQRKFDFWFLEWAFIKEGLEWSWRKMFDVRYGISTIKMASDAGYTGNNLKEWAKRLNFDLNHHDANSDTKCCREIYNFLTNDHNI